LRVAIVAGFSLMVPIYVVIQMLGKIYMMTKEGKISYMSKMIVDDPPASNILRNSFVNV
jgi:hypothetical protein